MSGTCVGEGSPTVRLAYSSTKYSLHNFETHWLGFSMSMVILARGHGSGNVDRQCSNSEVRSQEDADPPARFASHHSKDSEANSQGPETNKKKHKSLPRTQW